MALTLVPQFAGATWTDDLGREEATYSYLVKGTSDPVAAKAALPAKGTTHASLFSGGDANLIVVRRETKGKVGGPNGITGTGSACEATLTFRHQAMVPNNDELSTGRKARGFRIGVGSAHITKARNQYRWSKTETKVEDKPPTINVHGGNIEGTEIPVAQVNYFERWLIGNEATGTLAGCNYVPGMFQNIANGQDCWDSTVYELINGPSASTPTPTPTPTGNYYYYRMLQAMAGKTNNASFKLFRQRDVVFESADIEEMGWSRWAVTYNFRIENTWWYNAVLDPIYFEADTTAYPEPASPNQLFKHGHDYMWYEIDAANQATAAHVGQVLQELNFEVLGIGTLSIYP